MKKRILISLMALTALSLSCSGATSIIQAGGGALIDLTLPLGVQETIVKAADKPQVATTWNLIATDIETGLIPVFTSGTPSLTNLTGWLDAFQVKYKDYAQLLKLFQSVLQLLFEQSNTQKVADWMDSSDGGKQTRTTINLLLPHVVSAIREGVKDSGALMPLTARMSQEMSYKLRYERQ